MDDTSPFPAAGPTGADVARRQDRADRLKGALKANMARRKAQAQIRAQSRMGRHRDEEVGGAGERHEGASAPGPGQDGDDGAGAADRHDDDGNPGPGDRQEDAG